MRDKKKGKSEDDRCDIEHCKKICGKCGHTIGASVAYCQTCYVNINLYIKLLQDIQKRAEEILSTDTDPYVLVKALEHQLRWTHGENSRKRKEEEEAREAERRTDD